VSAELGKDEAEVTMELIMIVNNAKHIIWLAVNYLGMKGEMVLRFHRMRLLQGLSGFILVFLILHSITSPSTVSSSSTSPWTWVCSQQQKICLKQRMNQSLSSQSESSCRLQCSPENYLWPLPTIFSIEEKFRSFNPDNLVEDIKAPTKVKYLVRDALAWQVEKLVKHRKVEYSPVETNIQIEIKSDLIKPNLYMNEEYSLVIKEGGKNNILVEIRAETYFGARHGLETMFQLAQYDKFTLNYLISSSVNIIDKPYYPHRGVMLDTARNFIPVHKIKTMIDSMSYSKLNVFHWHITDSQSFPLVMDSLPQFAEYGSYSPEETYSPWEVEDIVSYAARKGVRVLPELDTPAHVGAGWDSVDPSYTLCVNKEPWTDWCVEPPCGQLNPASKGMYNLLENIYREMVTMFGDTQFHMGGDEIHVGCWNTSHDVTEWLRQRGRGREEDDFIFIWNHFLQESVRRIKKAGMTEPNLVLWNNGMTKAEHIHYLDPDLFAIQLWTNSRDLSDQTIKTVAEKGFKMIFSNYDSTYLDCGFGGWVSDGNNWCAPYKEWQLQHQNNPLRILEERNLSNLEEAKANILGGEVALWTEQADSDSMMSRIEPRAAAYGEQLWRGPITGGWLEAERRMVRHRVRLVDRGVGAETLTHGWCRQNEGKCVLGAGLDTDTEF